MYIGICSDEQTEMQKISQCIIRHTKFLKEDKLYFFSPEDILIDIEYYQVKCDILIIKSNCKADTLNGVQIAGLLLQSYPQCQIIFYSDNYEQVSDVYQVRHCYFLLLTQIEKYIKAAFEQAQIQLRKERPNHIEIVSNRHKIYIQSNDIIYIRRDNRKITIYTMTQEYNTYMTLVKLLEQLGGSFARCHIGYIVNMDYVESVNAKDLKLSYGQSLPLGRVYAESVKKEFRHRWNKGQSMQ